MAKLSGKKKAHVLAREQREQEQPQLSPVVADAPKVNVEDQNDVFSPEGDTTGTPPKPKKPKGVSNTVRAWKALADFPETHKIHFVPNPTAKAKIKKAADRFALYEEGMAVGDYMRISKDKGLNTLAGAMQDVRWDVAKGFITVSDK